MSESTHEVLNQSIPLENYNLYTSDTILQEVVKSEGGSWGEAKLTQFGKRVGSVEVIRWGFEANENPPVLKTHDRFGYRIDRVDFHPAWHSLMTTSIGNEIHSLPWTQPQKGAHVVRSALSFMIGQLEQGHGCPVTMTFASIPALRVQPEIAKEWEPKIMSTLYDPEFKPASQKKGLTIGMAMTEKQGGSDVRANTTRAVPVGSGGPGGEYLLTGHKWFCSAPMCDAFLVLAQTPKGLSCFLVPRWKPDDVQNNFFIQRLKDKLGNRSNASSEVEFSNTWGRMIGEEGRGVPTIIRMVNHTRLDCVIGSAAIMRQATVQAIHHCIYRSAFGKKLIDQALMKNVLADLALESEAATVLMMRLARAYDAVDHEEESLFRRMATAISKYWVCKRAPSHVYEALECLGGSGYVEESILPRLYRDAPLNSIWEGSGNVNCLDMLRAMKQEPRTLEILFSEIEKSGKENRSLSTFVDQLKNQFPKAEEMERQARRFIENLVLALQASLLVRSSPSSVSDAFCATRLGRDWGNCFGTLPSSVPLDLIIERSRLK